MIETVTRTRFINWFRQSDTYKDNFSFFAQASLYDYFEELELDTGEKVEFDPIAICCEYSEYENIEEYNKDYEPVKSIDEIRELTTVIETRNGYKGFIIQQYWPCFLAQVPIDLGQD